MVSAREALRICLRPEHLPRTLRIALVVGTTLTIINQADVILGGDATTGTWIKGRSSPIARPLSSRTSACLWASGPRRWRRASPDDGPGLAFRTNASASS